MQRSRIALLCAVDLWTVERQYWGSIPPASQAFLTDPAIEYLKKVKEPFRVMAEVDGSKPASAVDPMLHWDGLMAHRIRVTFGKGLSFREKSYHYFSCHRVPHFQGTVRRWGITSAYLSRRFLKTMIKEKTANEITASTTAIAFAPSTSPSLNLVKM